MWQPKGNAVVAAGFGAVAVLALVVARPAMASALAAGDRAAASAPAATLPVRRQRELDELRRQDVARDLKVRGVAVRWQDHGLAELLDWRDRVEGARALASDYGVQVDWRIETAAALADMRLRAAKAAEMRAAFGIVVEWQRYDWAQMERLRLSLAAVHPAAPERSAAIAGLAQARGAQAVTRAGRTGGRDLDGLVPFDPNRRVRRHGANPRDRDAIIEPVFASVTTTRAARRFSAFHPDGILEPTFARRLPRPSDRTRDDLVPPGR